ncbi:PQQ-binding-like beta-propeller repeat protein [Planctomycetota bacterium]
MQRLGNWVIVLIVSGPALVGSADWPQWRGPQRNGTWTEAGIVDRFTDTNPESRWQMPVGPGYNGPTVADGRVFVMDRLTEPHAAERIHCFAADTGHSLWIHTYPCVYTKVGYPAGPRAAVTIEQGRAYSLGAMGDLFCLDAGTGQVYWHQDLKKQFNIGIPTWGVSAAPLVWRDLLIIQAGGRDGACLVALDKKTGSEKWRALDDKASYVAPMIIEQAQQPVLVCWSGTQVSGLNPTTGTVHWQIPFKPIRMVIGIADPVYWQEHLFVSGFFDGSLLIKLHPNELQAEQVWHRRGKDERSTDALHCCISTPVIQDGHVYGVDSYGELRCLELASGDRVWESQAPMPKERWANIHMVQRDGQVWMFTERGDLLITELSPQGYQEISRTHLIDPTTVQLKRKGGVGVCWSHPAFAQQSVYVRNDQELRCFSLKKP